MREGPINIVSRRLSCSGCRHHDQVLMMSGLNPIYDHSCLHPAAQQPTFATQLLVDLMPRGRYVGRTDDTPAWCPLLNPGEPR